MFERLGHAIYRHRRLVLIASLVAAILCAIVAAFVFPRLGSQGFDDPGSDSTAAQAIMDRAREAGVFVHESPELVALLMQVDLDARIPPQLYIAVAELLAWVYRIERGKDPAIKLPAGG